MSVTNLHEWRVDGCDDRCFPRSHDPSAHEEYGRLLEREAQRPAVVRTGPLVVDLLTQTVTVDGIVVSLSPSEWALLAYLARRADTWCPVATIASEVLNDVNTRWPGHLTRVVMARLRLRLGGLRDIILTRTGFGYMLRSGMDRPLPVARIAPSRISDRWARHYDACSWCKTTERRHASRGLCRTCYARRARTGKFI